MKLGRPVRTLYCKIEGCGRAHYALDLCAGHYKRIKKYGNATSGRPLKEKITFEDWWDKVGKNAKPGRCIAWPSSTVGGYGPHARVTKKVYGNKPSPIHVSAHSCGKGREGCVNYHHLRWATPKENAQEAILHRLKGISPKLVPKKLSDSEVLDILARKNDKGSDLAKEFNVSESLVCRIRQRKRRGDVK